MVEEGRGSDHSDFWRVTRNGEGFLLRPMQEDRKGFMSGRAPQPVGPFFDWSLHIYRATELLKFVEFLGVRFSDENATFTARIQYCGMKDRALCDHQWKYNMPEGPSCAQTEIGSTITGTIDELGSNIEEKVFEMMTPIYEQFDFSKLPKLLVDNVVREVLQQRY